MNGLKRIFTREVRAWIYGIAIAAVPVLIYAGYLAPEAAPIVLPLILAILNLSPKDSAAPYEARHGTPRSPE